MTAYAWNGELGTLALGLVIAGVVGGLVAGMLGVGGGIVVVPILYHVLAALGVDESVRMHVAVGTSLATIIPTSFSSVQAHNRKGAVDWHLLRRWWLPMAGRWRAACAWPARSNPCSSRTSRTWRTRFASSCAMAMWS